MVIYFIQVEIDVVDVKKDIRCGDAFLADVGYSFLFAGVCFFTYSAFSSSSSLAVKTLMMKLVWILPANKYCIGFSEHYPKKIQMCWGSVVEKWKGPVPKIPSITG